jgi:hypothetical protein
MWGHLDDQQILGMNNYRKVLLVFILNCIAFRDRYPLFWVYITILFNNILIIFRKEFLLCEFLCDFVLFKIC